MQVNRWHFPRLCYCIGLFLPFFLAGEKTFVIPPLLRSAKPWRKKQSSSQHWSKKMLLSPTKALMTTAALLPSNRCPAMVSNELVPCLMQGRREGNAQPSVCINATKNLCSSLCRYVPIVCTYQAFAGCRKACLILIHIRTKGLSPLFCMHVCICVTVIVKVLCFRRIAVFDISDDVLMQSTVQRMIEAILL